MTRSPFSVCAIHLALSAAVLGGLFAVAALVWYPGPWLEVSGATESMMVLAAVLLVLGPLLTLLIWHHGAPGSVFDLAAVAIVQVAAVAYVGWTLAYQRPAFVVFDDGRFQLAAWPDVKGETVPDSLLGDMPSTGPLVVWAEPLDAGNDHLRVMARGRAEYRLPGRYRDLGKASGVLATSGTPAADLAARDARVRSELQVLLEPNAPVPESWRVYPVYGNRDGWSAVVDVETARIVDFVPAHSRWIRPGGERRAQLPARVRAGDAAARPSGGVAATSGQ